MNFPSAGAVRILRHSYLLFFGVLAASMAGCGDENASISEARALADGATATIEGFVIVPPGAFSSALGDEGFTLQDSTGSGLYVKVAQKLGFGLGAKVRATGTLGNQNQLRILQSEPASIQILDGTELILPKVVSTGDINESVEGSLVKVSGNITQTFQDDSPYGYKLYVDDGSGEVQVFVHVSAGFDKDELAALAAGRRLTVTGLAAQYETTYEVAPRQPSDLLIE